MNEIPPKIKNVLGQKFNRLTVIEYRGVLRKSALWLCLCDCGNTKEVRAADLIRYSIQSCGCARSNKRRKLPKYPDTDIADWRGKRVGYLTIKDLHEKCNPPKWLCECVCGTEVIRPYTTLNKRYMKQSCGCMNKVNRPEYKQSHVTNMKNVYRAYKAAANQRKYAFDIVVEDFERITSEDCHYCGSQPTNVSREIKSRAPYHYNGLDRVDNTRGYHLDNVVPCCGLCNRMKMDNSVEVLYEQVRKIYKHNNLGGNEPKGSSPRIRHGNRRASK